ncbi:ABC transporter ATP-binding protein/permease [Coprobacillus sp. AF33-1AC]|uniref:ABC transporter ATP-binding protein/permease n=1 Tax=Coprobacillus sp. AF33-1AC TaxID=2292032 RepID=UPI000E54E7DB|nr:ABC transporter ATP-binding protein/permease [Coprobacillus sp. AF33-1AC]RHM61857.1 ATP-binding cassette domain-containing protein [Coprobacillus sp. AF33-1AC]
MLQVKNIYKEYKTGNLVQVALNNVSLNLRDNEFVAILGPSGSGKTTLLNIIGGLDRYDRGDLVINGISTKQYKDRDWDSYRNHTIGFVFQSYNLIPHQTVLANVELALTISGISKSERKKRALEALKKVGLENQGHKKPNQMSGGQMQRVAIARALVNDPDILLADEPTGALDSDTSIQVMDLLKEVAKDRLVVMVTHNPKLAKDYATRIVELKDGVICSDSHPYDVDKKHLVPPRHRTMGKASMNFLTSLSLSFNNLKTKKARTLLTSFAGSIGIIGIALILSLSTGVNQYVKSIEEETLSEYPLQIQNTGFDMSSMLSNGQSDSQKKKDKSKIYVSSMVTGMLSTIGSNDLKSLKSYLDKNPDHINQYTNSIEYTYNAIPQIYSYNSQQVRQVHPDQSFKSIGLGSSTSSNSMMSSMMSTDVFYQMPNQSSLYENQYDIKAGNWPKKYNECVLVLNSNGSMSDFMLYTLGLRDFSELDSMIEKFSKEEKIDEVKIKDTYAYKDMLNKQFKLVNASDYYQYDDQYQVYKNKKDDQAYMQSLVENGEDIKIVGVVQPKDDTSATMLKPGIAYPATLTRHVINLANQSEIVKKQLAHPDIDVFTNKSFDYQQKNNFDMNSLIKVDQSKIQEAFKIDQSKLSFDTKSIDLSQIDTSQLPAIDINQMMSKVKFNVSKEQTDHIVKVITEDFQKYLVENNYQDPTKMEIYFNAYLQTSRAQTLIQNEMTKLIQESGLAEQFQNELSKEMSTMMSQYSKVLEQTIQAQLTKQMGHLASQFPKAISVDEKKLAQAFQMNMSQDELSELIVSMMQTETTSYDSNLTHLGYANYDKPSAINLYPKDFETKQKVKDILEKYNEKMKKVDEDKVITYTDYVGTIMSSVTDIINVISYVLIAFVAISLVVSSIMIGVITYISVLERKKEIGILRAMGASKGNISQVFNAETFIIGLLSGLLGIGITLILLVPGNMLIHSIADNNSVNAVLPIGGAIILIALSVCLTLLGGLIPARKASHEDPVKALRTE